MEKDSEIYFYGLNNEFSYMSNFYKTTFVDENGIKFNCSEQYFMYYKCKTFDPLNKQLLDSILKETSASNIKNFGRQVNNYKEEIWREKRYNIMLNALKLKFSQNNTLKNKLLSTKQKILYEASKYDKIWGIGFYDKDAVKINKENYGLNLLGKALMEVRNELSGGQ